MYLGSLTFRTGIALATTFPMNRRAFSSESLSKVGSGKRLFVT